MSRRVTVIVPGGGGAHRARCAAIAAVWGAAVLAAVGALWSCANTMRSTGPAEPREAEPGAVVFTPDERAMIYTLSPLPPVPPDPTNCAADDPAAARLGQYLFFDTRLSRSGMVSCATCHQPEREWTDGLRVPEQFGQGLRHVPSLWNVAYNRWFFWDGRADSLWSQALQPLENPGEHGAPRSQCARVIREDPSLRRAYERLFGEVPAEEPESSEPQPPVDRLFANVGKALAAYERRLVSRRSPFDVFVEGLRADDPGRLRALSPSAQRGLRLFIGAANCISCHHGSNFTDGEFHNTGIDALDPKAPPDAGRQQGIERLLADPFNAMGAYNDDAEGRRRRPTAFLINRSECRGQFKTPTLRNVAVTPPYMHRGELGTLRDVVRFYSTVPRSPGQTPAVAAAGPLSHGHASGGGTESVLVALNLSDDQIDDLVAFMDSLTDVNIDPALRAKPASPE